MEKLCVIQNKYYVRAVESLFHKLFRSSDQKKPLKGDILLNECMEAFSQLKTNKSLCCDGLPIVFYHEFRSEIGPRLVQCSNFCKQNIHLPLSQTAVITLLERKGKENTIINNYDESIIPQI